MKKRIFACVLALSTLCAISPVSAYANNQVVIGSCPNPMPDEYPDGYGRFVYGGDFFELKGFDEKGEPIIEDHTPERLSEEYYVTIPYEKYPFLDKLVEEHFLFTEDGSPYFRMFDVRDFLGEEVPEEMFPLIESLSDGFEDNVNFHTDAAVMDKEHVHVKSEESIENAKVCVFKYIGDDKDGNMIWCNIEESTLQGFDDEGKPIITPVGSSDGLGSLPFLTRNTITRNVNAYSACVYDLDGTPKFGGAKHMYEAEILSDTPDKTGGYALLGEYDIYEAIDMLNDEITLVLTDGGHFDENIIARCGDTNGDGILNIADFSEMASTDDEIKKILSYAQELPVPVYIDGEVYGYFRPGDSNLDGFVDVRDITTVNQHIIKENILPDYTQAVADVTYDENVNISDLGMLKKYIIKMIDSF